MRRWVRAAVDCLCGGCGSRQTVGSKVLEFHFERVARPKIRGECCAGPAPVEIDGPLDRPSPRPLDLSRLGLLSLDWQAQHSDRLQRALESREPGEEG